MDTVAYFALAFKFVNTFTLPEQFDEAVDAAAEALRRGDVILYPTDTVYGLGADVRNPDAVAKVREIKGRDERQMMLVMLPDLDFARDIAQVTPVAEQLAKYFLPGPLSLVLSMKKETLATASNEHLHSIGIRIPQHKFCLALARAFGRPIISTSANISGQATESNPDLILGQLGTRSKQLSIVVREGEKAKNVPSTIVDARGEKAVILREGAISKRSILEI